MCTSKLTIISLSLGGLLFILYTFVYPTSDISSDSNRTTELLARPIVKPQRCHNKGRNLNDWNYLLKNVLHSEQIYRDMDITGYEPDLQTWTDVGPTFERFLKIYLTKIKEKKSSNEPIRIIEVGSWKGTSSAAMASICRTLAHPRKCKVLAVDTWLGAPIVYTDRDAIIHKELSANNGYLKLFDKFLKNIIVLNVSDIVTPFRLPSLGAAHVLNCFGIKADIVYIDGDHEYEGVKADLAAYYPIVASGGLFFGDDAPNANVRRAVKEMIAELGDKLEMIDYRADSATWLTWKNS